MGIGQHHHMPALGGLGLDPKRKLREKRIGDIGHHQTNDIDLIGAQRPRRHIRAVFQRGHRRHDLGAQRVLDRGIAG